MRRMIVSGGNGESSARYLLTALDRHRLWRYDRRWRRSSVFSPFGEQPFLFLPGQGSAFALVTVHSGPPNLHLEVTVRSSHQVGIIRAQAVYEQEEWTFSGDNHAWAQVPEYVLLTSEELPADSPAPRPILLRIADDAEPDELEGVEGARVVTPVPGSRLVVLAGAGKIYVYEPVVRRVVANFDLAGGTEHLDLGFRDDNELWIADGDTLVKVDSKSWKVLDAAGTAEVVDAAEATAEGQKRSGHFGRWSFVADNELALVTRPDIGDVLALDAVTMLPVGRAVFRSRPLDACLLGKNLVLAVDDSGEVWRCRLRRVKRPG